MEVPDIDVERHEALRTIGQFKAFIGLCSCGLPEEFLRQLFTGLSAHPEPGQPAPRTYHFEWNPTTDTADMMTAYLLDCWELTEHALTLSSAWLTPDGIRLRDALGRVDLFDGSRDIDSLHFRGQWWQNELVLNRKVREGVAFAELGEWMPGAAYPPGEGPGVMTEPSRFPGNPNPRQVAHAAQRIAAVRQVVDQLIRSPLPGTGDRAADVLHLAHGPVIDAMVELSSPGHEQAVLTALSAELLYRLISGGVDRV